MITHLIDRNAFEMETGSMQLRPAAAGHAAIVTCRRWDQSGAC